MKKILLLIPALNAGGAERVIVTLANEWSKENDVSLMVYNDGTCFYELSEKVRLKPLNIVFRHKGILRKLLIPYVEYKRYQGIKKEIITGKYDFVLSFCLTTNIMASFFALFHKDVSVLVSERNDPNEYSYITQKTIRRFYNWCKAIVCQNKMVKDYFTENGVSTKLIILPNPVNFKDIPAERPQEIEHSIVTVGRLIKQKNQALLIQAFNLIKDEFPDYTLKIYGIGPLKEELVDIVNQYGLNERIFFMNTAKKVMYEVNKSAVFVLPSIFEGFPNVLIEAMATGMPVVSSNFKTGIASDLIKSERNGYLFETNNLEELVGAMRQLLNRTYDFDMMGEENRKIALEYKDNKVAELWLAEIEKTTQ